MFKRFMMKKMMQRQLQGQVSEEEQERLLDMVEQNPELFQKIATEAQQKIKSEGKDQMTAMTEVMQKYQSELQEAMQQNQQQ
jgi:hypothetical protein